MSGRSPKVVLLLGLGAALLVAFVLLGMSRLHVGSQYESFLPADDAVAAEMRDVADSFGGDPLVVLVEYDEDKPLEESANLAKLLRAEGRLAALDHVAAVYGPATTLNQTAIQVQNLLASISGFRDGLKEKGDKAAYEAFEKRYGSLVVRGLPAGLPTLKNPSFVTSVIYDADGRVRPQWQHLVPSEKAVALLVRPRAGLHQGETDRVVREVRRTMDASDLGQKKITLAGVPSLTRDLTRTVGLETPLLGAVALLAVAACLWLTPWVRSRRRRLRPLLPMAAAVLGTLAVLGWSGRSLSLGVVAFLPVLLGLGTYYPIYLAQRAHRRLILGVALAAAASFGSLALSPLPFVRDLGLAVAVGILLVLVCSTAVEKLLGSTDDELFDHRADTPNPALPRASVLVRGATPVVLALAVAGWALLPKLPIQTDPEQLLGGLSGLASAQHVEDVLGFSGQLDVVVDGDDVLRPEVLTWLRGVQDEIVTDHGDRLRPVASPVDVLGFLGRSPTAAQVDAAMELLPAYLTGAVVTPGRDRLVLSFGAELRRIDEQRAIVADVRQTLDDPPAGYDVRVSGIPVAAVHGYDVVSADRYLANLVGIVAAGLALLLVLRRRLDALRGVVAALLASGVGMFAVWLTGIDLTPITFALGSLMAAASGEFAVLMAAARRQGDPALHRSVLLAATLSALGYAALLLSSLDLVRQFGLVLMASVGLAVVAASCVTWMVPRRPEEHALEFTRVETEKELVDA
ncbi:hypothetical protein ASD11_14335 [Aeromicrobium sp. Root495]|uniref:MMPL family transporter n=1 Tax=Aeromicrobium sp. Root495 TaxID=1736550 RepID=UPI0006FF2516|nr:MMPL family transporter [Aeromicrobium sp. Root495]KQY55689.1 hypothetical protein ASD11_14335 [Aeromicrobium sp. Root495]